jgi:hypothetical protein
VNPTIARAATTLAAAATLTLTPGVAQASDCYNHPDACEPAAGGTDHSPELQRTITADADITHCVWVVCW